LLGKVSQALRTHAADVDPSCRYQWVYEDKLRYNKIALH